MLDKNVHLFKTSFSFDQNVIIYCLRKSSLELPKTVWDATLKVFALTVHRRLAAKSYKWLNRYVAA